MVFLGCMAMIFIVFYEFYWFFECFLKDFHSCSLPCKAIIREHWPFEALEGPLKCYCRPMCQSTLGHASAS